MTAKPSIAIIDNDLNLVKTYVVERYADAFIAKNPELKKVSYDEYLVLNSGTPVKEEEEVKEETATPSEKTETVQKRVEEKEEVATEKAEDSVESKENVNQNNNTGTIITSDSIGTIEGKGVNASSEYTVSGIERSGVSVKVKKTGNTPVEVICTYVKPKNPVSRFVAYVKGIFKK